MIFILMVIIPIFITTFYSVGILLKVVEYAKSGTKIDLFIDALFISISISAITTYYTILN